MNSAIAQPPTPQSSATGMPSLTPLNTGAANMASLISPAMAAPSPALSEADSSVSVGGRTATKRTFDELGTGAGEDSDSDSQPPSTTRDKRAGRRKIKIEYIEDKSRRHITFSKRKAGIMKKAYELSTLTGTQVLLLVVSETGLVYTFTTPKLQPLVTKPEGKNLIQACLNAPDPLPDLPQSTAATTASPASLHGPQTPGYPADQNTAVSDPHSDIAAAAAAAAAASLYSPPPVGGVDPHKSQASTGYPLGLANLGYPHQPTAVGYSGNSMNTIAQQYGAAAVPSPYSPAGAYAASPSTAHYGTSSAAATAASMYAPYWSGAPHSGYPGQSQAQPHLGVSPTQSQFAPQPGHELMPLGDVDGRHFTENVPAAQPMNSRGRTARKSGDELKQQNKA